MYTEMLYFGVEISNKNSAPVEKQSYVRNFYLLNKSNFLNFYLFQLTLLIYIFSELNVP